MAGLVPGHLEVDARGKRGHEAALHSTAARHAAHLRRQGPEMTGAPP